MTFAIELPNSLFNMCPRPDEFSTLCITLFAGQRVIKSDENSGQKSNILLRWHMLCVVSEVIWTFKLRERETIACKIHRQSDKREEKFQLMHSGIWTIAKRSNGKDEDEVERNTIAFHLL